MPPAFDLSAVRKCFPALERSVDGRRAAYFDGPAGSQVPRCVADAVADCMLRTNANHGGPFATSRESDHRLDEAHRALADFVGTDDPETVSFGPNMTTLTFALSRALARSWKPGDEILVTQLDHDANVTPWVLAARDAGARIRPIEVREEDCTLDVEDFRSKLSEKTRLVALGLASNATGTVNPVEEMTRAAHAAGALVFVDAVHYAPHRTIDVVELDCDFLACSAYKFFGPHVGVQWGRRELLESIVPYKLRPAPEELPGKWMTGTQNHEGIVGAAAAVDYLAGLVDRSEEPRRERLVRSFEAIVEWEHHLLKRLLEGLESLSCYRVWGVTDSARFAQRVPTVSLTHESRTAREVAEALGSQGLFCWCGNHYALPFTERFGLEPAGTLRIGLLHYNTLEEVDRLLVALEAFT